MANLLEIDGANPFRVRAYREAARVALNETSSLVDRSLKGEDLTRIPGIGKDLAQRIEEVARTGRMSALRELERKVPRGLGTLLKIPGLGPKRVRALHDRLGVKDRKDLQRVLRTGKLRELPGFGALTERAISQALSGGETKKERIPVEPAIEASDRIIAELKKVPGVDHAMAAGSLRRRLESVGDVDILVSLKDSAQPTAAIRAFVESQDVYRVVARGTTRAAVQLALPDGRGLRVDLRVVPRESFGAALYYFTGSKAHNIHVRGLAQKLGLKINEYGVFKGPRRVAGRTEASVLKSVGLPFIEPEMREDRGEIEAASFGELPQLVERSEIRGALHSSISPDFSDLEERAREAKALGLEFLGVPVIGPHDRPDRRGWLARLRQIERVDGKVRGLRIVRLAEAAIHEDGSLSVPDWMLSGLDGVIGWVHSATALSREAQTERFLRALEHPVLSAIGPSLTASSPAFNLEERVDLPRLLTALGQRGRAVDIDAVDPRQAKAAHARVMIRRALPHGLDRGIDRARRGWLEPWEVVNTRRTSQLLKILKRK